MLHLILAITFFNHFLFFILGCMWYLDYPEYLKVYSLNLWMLVKDFFITINVFKNFVHLLWFKWHFNECTIRKYMFSSWRPSPFIMIFIINHKTPTMTAHQFYKQALTNWWQEDTWELKFGPKLQYDELLQKHAKLEAIVFCVELTGTFYIWILCNHLFYALFFVFLFSFLWLHSL